MIVARSVRLFDLFSMGITSPTRPARKARASIVNRTLPASETARTESPLFTAKGRVSNLGVILCPGAILNKAVMPAASIASLDFSASSNGTSAIRVSKSSPVMRRPSAIAALACGTGRWIVIFAVTHTRTLLLWSYSTFPRQRNAPCGAA